MYSNPCIRIVQCVNFEPTGEGTNINVEPNHRNIAYNNTMQQLPCKQFLSTLHVGFGFQSVQSQRMPFHHTRLQASFNAWQRNPSRVVSTRVREFITVSLASSPENTKPRFLNETTARANGSLHRVPAFHSSSVNVSLRT